MEQMQYHVANLEAQKRVLEITRDYLDREADRAENCNNPTIDNPFLGICPSNPHNILIPFSTNSSLSNTTWKMKLRSPKGQDIVAW